MWASSATTAVVCAIFFALWRWRYHRRHRRRRSPPSSDHQVCQNSQTSRPYLGEFQLSPRRSETSAALPVFTESPGGLTGQNYRECQPTVLRPTAVPVSALPTNSECVPTVQNELVGATAPIFSIENGSNKSDICPRSLRESVETSTLSFVHCSDIYTVSERSNMRVVSGKLVVSVAHHVTSRGDCLVLDNMGIALWVPPNAVPIGEEKLVCLVLNWDLSDNPSMSETESLVSPVVYVGPHGLKLNKPCELRYRHCAYDPRHIVVMRSETDLYEDKQWEEMCGQESQGDICRLTSDECRLKILSFTLFTCIQRPLRNLKMAKWLQIAAFSTPLTKRIDHHEVRVYFLNKTPCALQWAIQNEAQFQHVLMCPEKAFLFHGQLQDILDIRVTLKYLSSEWESVEGDEYERVPYLHVWHGQCPHIVMCFKKKAQQAVRELNFHLNVYQETMENEGEKVVVHATEDPKQIIDNTCIINIHASQSQDTGSFPNVEVKKTEENVNVSVKSGSTPCCSAPFFEQVCKDSTHYIPYELRSKLRVKLDPTNPLGNDWRRLADLLNLSQYIEYLKCLQSSPTEELLCVVEHRNMTLEELVAMLHEIRRLDAEAIVREFICQHPDFSAANTRDGHQHDERNIPPTDNFNNLSQDNPAFAY